MYVQTRSGLIEPPVIERLCNRSPTSKRPTVERAYRTLLILPQGMRFGLVATLNNGELN
jgi:hypothetical protein